MAAKQRLRRLVQLSTILCLIGCIGYGLSGWAQAPQAKLTLATDPPIDQVAPFTQPVNVTLTAVDPSGANLQNAKFHLQVLTPPKTPWFTTDFPIVEGTELLNIQTASPDGSLSFTQVFPIRGTYQLLAEVTPLIPEAFAPIQQTLTLTVPETSIKYRNLLILAIVLLGLGWLGGWIIGNQQSLQPGEVVPQRVRLLLSGLIGVAIITLLVINISAELTESHSHHHEHRLLTQPSLLQSEGLELKLSGDDEATVGQMANLAVQAVNLQTGQPVSDVIFRVKAIQLEDNEPVFAYQSRPDANGLLTWQQQFFDGAPHQVTVEVAPQPNATRQFQPFSVAKEVEVAGVAPPLLTRLISLFYFLGLLLVGLISGLWWQKRRKPVTRHAVLTKGY